MSVSKVKKRTGVVVDFNRSRIERAIRLACLDTGLNIEEALLASIADSVVSELNNRFVEEVIPGVEDIQDVVERKLAENGLFDVAKSYILYRKEHEEMREKEKQALLEKMERHEIRVKKRDGTLVKFDVREIERVFLGCLGDRKGEIDVDSVLYDTKLALYDGILTKDINTGLIMALRARIERDPLYSFLASQMLFNELYKNVLGTYEFEKGFDAAYRAQLEAQIKKGVECGRLSPKLLEFDFETLSAALEPERDRLFKYIGAQTLYDRYFLRDYDQAILELPQYFWMRIAMGLALNETDKEAKAIEFYGVMSQLLYVPSTPTLFHSGQVRSQMSSCYLNTVEDDLEHIFKVFGDNAQLSKYSGGIGTDWSNIRGTGALIRATNVGSQGVVPFLKIADATTAAINRSGKRRGAACVYLETWHYDIEDFLELRKNTGDERRRTHDTNTANWIPDLFMKRVEEDGRWTLFSPDEVSELHHTYGRDFEERYVAYEEKADRGEINLFKVMRAQDLWRKMVTMLFETGHPWVTFKDPSNIRSPQDHVGVIHSSNLCTEITLNTSKEETAVCNLGSVNIVQHIRDGELDFELIGKTVTTATRMLDNVIDLNFYPTKEAENSNLKHRPIGLGIMGTQDAFYLLGLDFDSNEAVAFGDRVMEYVSYYAILGSSKIAKEKGAYESCKGSKWDRGLFPIDTLKLLEKERGIETGVDLSRHMDWTPVREHVKQYGMRNSNTMAIAPTATIANICGCLPSIEPIYKNLYVKSNFSGEFTVINEYLVIELKNLGLWNDETMEKLKYYDGSIQRIMSIPAEVRERYKEVFEIDAHWIVTHAAHRGKWIDQSQSVNIFTSSESGKFIADIYFTAWRMGLKTTYYLRTLGASRIEHSTLDINKKYDDTSSKSSEPVRQAHGEPILSETVTVAQIVTPQMEEVIVEKKVVRTAGNIRYFEDGTCESCQ